MAEQDWLAGQFEQNRQHLQAVAYSMLGTVSEAQDAVQEAWLRLGRSDPGGIGDLRGWLTTVVGRISLDMLRARRARRRVQAAPQPDRDVARQRRVVEAFLAAARGGDFEALLQVLDPDVVFRMDLGPASLLAHRPLAGAVPVARQVLATAPRFVHLAQPVLVNGEAGALFGTREDPVAVVGFTIVGGRIAALNLIAD